MTGKTRAPLWLRAATTVVVVESIAQFVFFPAAVLGAVTLSASILVAYFLLRGSRVAWVIIVFSATAQVAAPVATSQPVWYGVAGAILLACLLVPTSRRYVWAERPRQRRPTGQRAYARLIDSAYTLVGRLPGMGTALRDDVAAKFPSPRGLVLLLIVWILVFLPLVGALNNLRHGSAQGNELVDVLWHVLWIVWNLVLFSLIALLVIAHTSRKRNEPANRRP